MIILLFLLSASLACASIERYFPEHKQFVLPDEIYEQLCRKEMERYVKNDERLQGIQEVPPVPEHLRHLVDVQMLGAQERISHCLQEVARLLYEHKDNVWKAEMQLNMHEEEHVYIFWSCLTQTQRQTILARYKASKEQTNKFLNDSVRKARKESEFIATHPILRPPVLKFLDKLMDGVKLIEKFSKFLEDIPIIGQLYGPLIGDQISRIMTFATQMNEVLQSRATFGGAMLNVAKHSATKMYERLTSEDSLL